MNKVVGFRCIAVAGLFALTSSASEAALARYDFEGTTINAPTPDSTADASRFEIWGASPLGATTTGTNLTPSVAGYTSTGSMSAGTSSGTRRTYWYSSATATTFQTNDYLRFTLAPRPTLDLETFSIDFAKDKDERTSGFVVRYSFDNFATYLTAGAGEITNTTAGIAGGFVRHTFALTDQFPTQQLTTSPVQFRLYGYTEGAYQAVQFDNIEVTGLPEPTGLALIGVGAMGLLARRHRAR